MCTNWFPSQESGAKQRFFVILHLVSHVFLCSCVAGQLDCAACYARIAAGAARAYPHDLGVADFIFSSKISIGGFID